MISQLELELASAKAKVVCLEAEIRRLRGGEETFEGETAEGVKLVYYAQSQRIELIDGRLMGNAPPDVALRFLREAILFSVPELHALFAAALLEDEPGRVRRKALLLLLDD